MALGCFDDSTEDMAGRFIDFLNGDDEAQAIRHFDGSWPSDPRPSLMDLIAGWVWFGDATHVCGSYENFLLAVISITDHWLHGGAPSWEGRNGGQIPINEYKLSSEDGGGREDYVLMHDALSRTLWEVIGKKNSSKRERDLLRMIEDAQRT